VLAENWVSRPTGYIIAVALSGLLAVAFFRRPDRTSARNRPETPSGNLAARMLPPQGRTSSLSSMYSALATRHLPWFAMFLSIDVEHILIWHHSKAERVSAFHYARQLTTLPSDLWSLP